MKNILKSIGFVALYVITYFIASILTGIALGTFIAVKAIVSRQQGVAIAANLQNELTSNISILLIGTSIIAFLLIWLIFLIRKKSLFETCSFKRVSLKETGILIIAGIALSMFMSYAMTYAIQFTSLKNFVSDYEKYTRPLMEGNFIVTLLAAGIAAPVFEEIFFRGLIFNELRRSMPTGVATILQALLFAAFHMNLIQGTYTFIIGILFALAYIWFKSIWASIALHLFFNNTSIMMGKLANQQILDDYSTVFIAFSFIICAISFYLLWKRRIRDNSTEQVIVSEDLDNLSV